MEEEGARRRAYKGRDGAGLAGFLPNLNEDDEDEEDVPMSVRAQVEAVTRVAGPREQLRRRQGHGFELTMDGATLLGRRHKRGAASGKSPLALGTITPDTITAPQSPMHY